MSDLNEARRLASMEWPKGGVADILARAFKELDAECGLAITMLDELGHDLLGKESRAVLAKRAHKRADALRAMLWQPAKAARRET